MNERVEFHLVSENIAVRGSIFLGTLLLLENIL